jgi:hypothetical protein
VSGMWHASRFPKGRSAPRLERAERGSATQVLASAQFQETPIAMAQAMRGETAPVDSAGKRMLVER